MPVEALDYELRRRAKAMIAQGTTSADVARVLGLHPGTVRIWKRRYEWGLHLTSVKAASQPTEHEDGSLSIRALLIVAFVQKDALRLVPYPRCPPSEFNGGKQLRGPVAPLRRRKLLLLCS